MNPAAQFLEERRVRIAKYAQDNVLQRLSQDWLRTSMDRGYVYNFDWLGRPIIQYPNDIVAFQEIVWRVQPDLIIETGIAHGGSLVLSASLLALLDVADAAESGGLLDPSKPARKVVGVDIEIRAHNRRAIEDHPFSAWIEMIEGSSIDPATIEAVARAVAGRARVLVCLDSMHTHEHVLAELQAYAPLASIGSYCIVFDTFVEDMPAGFFADRPWDVGNNPKTAVHEFLRSDQRFEVDLTIQQKLQATAAPQGHLRRIS